MARFKELIKEAPIVGDLVRKAADEIRLIRKRAKRRAFFLANQQFLAKNAGLKDLYKGKRIFILSAGPSIKDQDLSELENEICLSLGNVFVHPAFAKIRPKFHLFASSHTPITDDQYISWFQEAEKHLSADQSVLVSLTDKYMTDRNSLFQKVKDIVYYMSDENDFGVFKRDIDFTNMLPPIQTQVHWVIYLAIYLGASEIYLIGCDHSWHLSGVEYDVKTGRSHSKHFYDYKNFIPFQKGYNDEPSNMENQFKSYLKLWKVYRYIKQHVEQRGVAIFNATPGSLLDLFPRRDLREILGQKVTADQKTS